MNKILVFIALLAFVLTLWYLSIVFPSGGVNHIDLNSLITNANNWFSVVSLLLALFALYLVVIKIELQHKQFSRLMSQNNLNLEIMALSSLIQESDATLHRYERWEAAGIKGDYVNAKSDVRDKMKNYRELLDKKFIAVSDI